jgi:Ca2+-binding EF-hand superfamily protein
LLDLLEPEDLEEIQATFHALDEDGSGSIDVNEIQRFLDKEFQVLLVTSIYCVLKVSFCNVDNRMKKNV